MFNMLFMKYGFYTLAALFVVVVAGCGGNGSSPSQPSPYNGNYTGNWTSSSGDIGSAQMDIAQSGSFTGTIDDTTASMTGTLKGSITNSGNMNVTVSFTGRASYSGTGMFTKDNAGDVSGTITSTNSGKTTTVQYQFTPNP